MSLLQRRQKSSVAGKGLNRDDCSRTQTDGRHGNGWWRRMADLRHAGITAGSPHCIIQTLCIIDSIFCRRESLQAFSFQKEASRIGFSAVWLRSLLQASSANQIFRGNTIRRRLHINYLKYIIKINKIHRFVKSKIKSNRVLTCSFCRSFHFFCFYFY